MTRRRRFAGGCLSQSIWHVELMSAVTQIDTADVQKSKYGRRPSDVDRITVRYLNSHEHSIRRD